jgi:hypothetical protein
MRIICVYLRYDDLLFIEMLRMRLAELEEQDTGWLRLTTGTSAVCCTCCTASRVGHGKRLCLPRRPDSDSKPF